MSSGTKMTLAAFILMILTSVFGVVNIGIAFYRMGYAAIPMFVASGFLFFLPFIFMMVEFGNTFQGREGGMYTWMEESIGPKFAIVGILMWYASYVIWMFAKSANILISLSFGVLGRDAVSDLPAFLVALIGVGVMVFVGMIISLGASKLSKVAAIGGMAVLALNFVLLIGGLLVLIINGGFAEPIVSGSFTTSVNPDYQSTIPFLGFVVMSVFAFGGTEAMAGVSEDLEDPDNLSKGLFIAAIFCIVAYVLGILFVGAIMKWADFPENTGSLSALFYIMENIGIQLGSEGLGEFLMRFAGVGMFVTYFGALIALCYAPLKQLVSGTPESYWPNGFSDENSNGVMVKALWAQMGVVIVLLLIYGFMAIISADAAATFFELTVTMTNVGMTIPYVFLIIAWFALRLKGGVSDSDAFIKGPLVYFCFVASLVLVVFGNVFTIISTLEDTTTFIMTIACPILFGGIGLAMTTRA